jgi:RNA polymerase sigma factor (TIGR02999 family)
MAETSDTTQLLVESRQGHKEALDALMPQVHDELRKIAHRLLQKRPAGHMLTTTALVHEAYLKLIDQSRVEWSDRAHFQALSARVMRQILIDYFRKQTAEKRGGDAPMVSLEEGRIPVDQRGETLLALDEALDRLSDRDPRKAQIVMYQFFGGMTQRAIADVLDVSARTVRREWRKARAWLARELSGHGIEREDEEANSTS